MNNEKVLGIVFSVVLISIFFLFVGIYFHTEYKQFLINDNCNNENNYSETILYSYDLNSNYFVMKKDEYEDNSFIVNVKNGDVYENTKVNIDFFKVELVNDRNYSKIITKTITNKNCISIQNTKLELPYDYIII